MLIELKKFGDILTSREAGREALSAFLPTLNVLDKNERITIDFQGVSVLTPSWADEFIRPILEKYTKRVLLINDANPSVQAAMRFAQKPKLDLNNVTVFQDVLVFDEATDDKIHNTDKAVFVLTFPYSDEDALRILTNNKAKKIYIHPVDNLNGSRLKAVTQMLNQAGIETVISK
jgi:hypothetical protein